MTNPDPIQKIEHMVKDIHDKAGKITQPVLSRYPLLFAFLLTFSFASILHGFQMYMDKIEFIDEHPLFLVGIGAFLLTLTGTLYKFLKKAGEEE